MGDILEAVFEFLFEIVIEGVLEGWMYIYVKFASVFLPHNKVSKKTEERIKKVISLISVLLVFSLLLGIMFLITENKKLMLAGNIMVLVPSVLFVIQIISGVTLLVVKKVKKSRK